MRTLVVVLGHCAVGTVAVERITFVMQSVCALRTIDTDMGTPAQQRGFEERPQIAVDVIEHVNNGPAYRRRLDVPRVGFNRNAQALRNLCDLIVACM